MSQNFAIHWFRRDLRLEGNAQFFQQVKKYEGRVLGVFIFDPKFLARADFSNARFDFFIETLKQLSQSLNELGSDLLILDLGPDNAWTELLNNILKVKPTSISYNRDYEPFARQRDEKMQIFFKAHGIVTEHGRDHLLIEPHELLKDDGTYYKVFTPFSKKWKSLFLQPEIQKRIAYADWMPPKGKKLCQLSWSDVSTSKKNTSMEVLLEYQKKSQKKHSIILPTAGHLASLQALKVFTKKVEQYGSHRDFPSVEGTSRLSIYFKNGSLTTLQVIKKLSLNNTKLSNGQEKFLNEIIWREFYYHLIYHEPTVEHSVFQKKFSNIAWEKNSLHLQSWKDGMTGFPIVDAGMRELKQTGWMHNRVRMIVASFLCKDLLINYQEGERHFMELLLDGDLAPNNGGWQWAASTGCDAQPYFRIFNPWTQGLRFDPDATYIKKFVPELKLDSAKTIHKAEAERSRDYPAPIVNHEIQRALALKIYTQH